VRDTAVGPYLVLDERSSEHLLAQVRRALADKVPGEAAPVVLVSMDVRRYVRGFLIRNGLDIAVLSYQDLAGDFTIQPVGSIGLGNIRRERAPVEASEREAVPVG
jgi:type III secretion protein V